MQIKWRRVLNNVLEFRGVTVVRNGNKVLDNISFTIKEGEDIAVLGPNGSGKSTILGLIIRRFYPVSSAGSVFKVWGEERWNIMELKNMLGIVSDDLLKDFDRDITVEEAVLSGFFGSIGLYNAVPDARMKKKTAETFRFMGIKGLENRKMNTLSSGEFRLALIARALAHKPKALILDEPCSGLDMVAAAAFRKMLGSIAAAGTSIIIATHDLNDIIPEIKRVVMIKKGGIFMDGKRTDILNDKNLSKLFGSKISFYGGKK